MELYVLSKDNLTTLAIYKDLNYEINLDEETNSKTVFTLEKKSGLQKGNFLIVNGLYRQFLFIIDSVNTEKNNNTAIVTLLDISNIFDRKIIEKDTNIMIEQGIEDFIEYNILNNFVVTDDPILNISYIDIYVHTHTQKNENTNSEDCLYNLHTFIINCRQNSNIYTDFKFENGRLRIDIQNKINMETMNIDTTLPEVIDYKKVYEQKITAKVECYCRDTRNIFNLYLKTDKTTTTNKNDRNRATGEIETISVEKEEDAYNECLNIIKGNSYKHLIEFKIAKTSKLIDVTKLQIGTLVKIKTDEDVYDSYISAITLTDDNFIKFRSGNIRVDFIDKIKQKELKNK